VAAVRAGAWAYLMKTCSTPDLLVAVEQAIRQIEHLEEKRELMSRARVAEKLAAIGTLTAGLSHEIKNPLNAAALQLSVLERRIGRLPPEVQPELRGPLKLVKDEVARLNGIVEEFLSFASPRELFKVSVELAPLLDHVADFLAPQAEAAGVRLERRCDGLAVVAGDEVRLKQAVVNLVLNAIQATGPLGTVSIQADQRDREVLISVEDTGAGIPAEIRNRIFEPFFTTKPGGSGLGLPLVHRIVEQHDGTISVERSDKSGTRFVIRLPAAP
jgi:two-component system, NtrC family, sensor histidine kinase HydH